MKYAIRLYKVFTSREDARLKFEPSIWVGASLDVLLGGVEHFLKYGAEETPETEEEKAAALKQAAFLQFAVRLADVGKCWCNWDLLGPVLQQSMIDLHVHKAFAGAPAELRSALIQALSTETAS